MEPGALARFEAMAHSGLELGDQAAQAQLMQVGMQLEHVATIQGVLDASQSSVAIRAAADALLRLVTEKWHSFSSECGGRPAHTRRRCHFLRLSSPSRRF